VSLVSPLEVAATFWKPIAAQQVAALILPNRWDFPLG